MYLAKINRQTNEYTPLHTFFMKKKKKKEHDLDIQLNLGLNLTLTLSLISCHLTFLCLNFLINKMGIEK